MIHEEAVRRDEGKEESRNERKHSEDKMSGVKEERHGSKG